MGQKLYLECYSGISGDMTVAALSGLMKDRTPLFCVLDHMPVEGFSYELKQVKKSGIDAWDFLVKLDAEHENHDHDMEYLHGHSHTHDHDHQNGHAQHQERAEKADPPQAPGRAAAPPARGSMSCPSPASRSRWPGSKGQGKAKKTLCGG